MIKKCVVFVVSVLFMFSVSAKLPTKKLHQYVHKNWQIEDGLPQNSILSMLQTSDGYIWLGTWEGLLRFDGIKFRLFNNSNVPKMIQPSIHALFEDSENVLWIGTYDGLLSYKKGTFSRFSVEDGLAGKMVNAVVEDRSGRIWVGTNKGLVYKDKNSDRFHLADGLKNLKYWKLFKSRSGNVIVYTDRGLFHYNGLSFEPFLQDTIDTDVIVNAFLEDPEGVLWVGTNDGLLRIGDSKLKKYSTETGLSGNMVTSLLQDKSGTLWIGTQSRGLNILNDEDISSFSEKYPNSDDWVFSIMEDREGNVWVGTNNHGLHMYRDAPFTTFSVEDGMSGEAVRSVYEDSFGKLWIGTGGNGANVFKNGSFERIGPDEDKSIITSFCDNSGKHIWVGGSNGLSQFKKGRLIGVDKTPVTALYRDSCGRLFVGGIADLRYYYNGGFYSIKDGNGNYIKAAQYIFEDSTGRIWVGTYGNGLYLIEGEDVIRFTSKDGLPNEIVFSIYEDNEKNIWIGSWGGLSLFRNRKFVTIAQKDGLFDNSAAAIFEDILGYLWISSNKGIFRVLRQELQDFADGKKTSVVSTVFNKDDGMKSRECNGANQPAGWKRKDGTIWFPTIRGVAAVDPVDLKINNLPPPVYIEEFIQDGRELKFDKEVRLQPGGDKLEFHYTALSFVKSDKIEFKYMLEGHDKEWINSGTRRIAYYNNLSPGTYIFRVKAANTDGVWNEKGASVKFIKLPFFYQTFWFYFLCFLGTVAIIAAIYTSRVRELKNINRKLKSLDKIKDRFLANTSHELRTPIHGIMGLTESILERAGNKVGPDVVYNLKIIESSAKRLSLLVDDILDFEKMKEKDVLFIKTAVNLREVVDSVFAVCEPLKSGKSLNLENRINDTTPAVLADKSRLFQIFYNLIGNAVKFTDEGEISVSAEVKGNMIRIFVSDTGTGIPEEKFETIFKSFEQADNSIEQYYGGTGLGLSITKRLVELHGGTISVESKVGEGSTFIFTLEKTDESPVEDDKRVKQYRSAKKVEDPVDCPRSPGCELNTVYTILTVDDESINQQVLKNYLLPESYSLDQVYSGEKALEYLETNRKPDLILLDIMMPGMSGYEVCRIIREKYTSAELPIIMLTAKDRDTDLVAGFKSGANDYLPKPFSKSELIARINSYIELTEGLDAEKEELIKERDAATEMVAELREKYGNARLEDSFMKELEKQLKELVEKEKFYRDPEISLKKLSGKMGITSNDLSQFINRKYNCTFYKFINSYRIDDIKKMIKDPANKKENIIILAYRVGFKNKSTFNMVFKKITGMTPTQYKKQSVD